MQKVGANDIDKVLFLSVKSSIAGFLKKRPNDYEKRPLATTLFYS